MSSEASTPSLADQWAKGHAWHASQAKQRIAVARRCLQLIQPIAALDDVADFGCGIGAWLAAAQELGARRITGFEGDWIAKSEVVVPREAIQVVDLAATVLDHAKRFSLAMTIEVAEHLPEQSADGFVRTLINASDYVLFSAAIPGQGGSGHINEQPLPYWVEKFWRRGYVPLEPIRPHISNEHHIFPWIRQNIVMFVSYDVIIRRPEVIRYARPLRDFSLRYVPLTRQ